MPIEPSEVKQIHKILNEDIEKSITIHGTVETRGPVPRLIEVKEDYPNKNRLPLSIPLVNNSELKQDSYMIVKGILNTTSPNPSFGNLNLSIEEYEIYPASLGEHASETSKTKCFKQVSEVLECYTEPIPVRYIIETVIETGFKREIVEDVISRMENSGHIYSPSTGLAAAMK